MGPPKSRPAPTVPRPAVECRCGCEYLFVPDGITDADILDFLSNPERKFSYRIRADKTVLVESPCLVVARDLRTAVRYCIVKQREERKVA